MDGPAEPEERKALENYCYYYYYNSFRWGIAMVVYSMVGAAHSYYNDATVFNISNGLHKRALGLAQMYRLFKSKMAISNVERLRRVALPTASFPQSTNIEKGF